MVTLAKPEELYDRETEWADLGTFATRPEVGASLSLMYGRRRQGKTLMTAELLHAARARTDVELIDLTRLYSGD